MGAGRTLPYGVALAGAVEQIPAPDATRAPVARRPAPAPNVRAGRGWFTVVVSAPTERGVPWQ